MCKEASLARDFLRHVQGSVQSNAQRDCRRDVRRGVGENRLALARHHAGSAVPAWSRHWRTTPSPLQVTVGSLAFDDVLRTPLPTDFCCAVTNESVLLLGDQLAWQAIVGTRDADAAARALLVRFALRSPRWTTHALDCESTVCVTLSSGLSSAHLLIDAAHFGTGRPVRAPR